jgi:hypothetical protein
MSDAGVINVLLDVNLVFAVGGGLWLAGDMTRVRGGRTWKWLIAFWGIYLAEGVAFSASMATNVLNFALAVVWGFVFSRWVRGLDQKTARKIIVRLTLYTCLPAVSFLSVFVLMIIGGWPVFTSQGGYKFGVPDFVPWPFCTVTGFFAACVGSAVVVKTAVTMVIALRRMARPKLTAD